MALAGNGWFEKYHADESPSMPTVYLTSIYWAMTTMTTVGYGDIIPTSDSERFFSIIAMIVGGAFYGYLVGSITDVVIRPGLAREYQERMHLVLTFVDSY